MAIAGSKNLILFHNSPTPRLFSSKPNPSILISRTKFCTGRSLSKALVKPLCCASRAINNPTTCNFNYSLLSLLYKSNANRNRNALWRWRVAVGDNDDMEMEVEMDMDRDFPLLDDEEVDEEEEEESLNWQDYEVEYGAEATSASTQTPTPTDSFFDTGGAESDSFVNTQGWESRTVVDHKIDQDEFHKIKLLDCDFFIRKVPDPDNDVYDFREMYVTPPETDVYSIPEVVGKMPKKHVRLRKTDYGCYHTTELPMDKVRDPWYKSEYEVMKVFLMKHYKNKRADDPDFVLDFEEIYVIDSKTKSISRAMVVVNVPRGKKRNRREEILIARDQGTSFKIIPSEKRDSPDVVIEKMKWEKSRKEMENYLRSFRDYEISNWF